MLNKLLTKGYLAYLRSQENASGIGILVKVPKIFLRTGTNKKKWHFPYITLFDLSNIANRWELALLSYMAEKVGQPAKWTQN